MMKKLLADDIEYICHHMMGVNWLPSFIAFTNNAERRAILQILDRCESKLEIMYFLGIAHYLYRNFDTSNIEYPPFYVGYRCHHDEQRGIHIGEPWLGFKGQWGDFGPSSMMVIPQYKSPEKDIHHDFAIFTASDNGGGPPWYFSAAIEIEGYGVHKSRRHADDNRYSGLSYDVLRVYEETTEPLDWFKIFINYYQGLQADEDLPVLAHDDFDF